MRNIHALIDTEFGKESEKMGTSGEENCQI